MIPKTPKRTISAAELRRWRNELGLTQGQLGEAIGLTQQCLGHYETGHKVCPERTIKQLLSLAKEWGVEPPRTHPRVVNIAAPVVTSRVTKDPPVLSVAPEAAPAVAQSAVPVAAVVPVNDGFGG